MKRLVPSLILATVLMLACQHSAYSNPISRKIPFQVFSTQIKGISYNVDPRIELFQAVMMLTGNPQINYVGADYKLAIAKRFAPYQQHSLFGFIRKYAPQGRLFTAIDAPISYMMHLTPDMEWRKDMENPYRKEPLLDSLRILMQQFIVESRYADFFNSNAPFYRLCLSNLQFNLGEQDERRRILAYYGVSDTNQIRFNVILNVLGFGNFGPRLKTASGTECYAIIAPNGSYDGVPAFNHKDLYGLIWHEFGHSFGNPLVEENMAQFDALSSLWKPIEAAMQSHYYAEWKAALWEHLVNAAMCRLAADKHGEEYAQINYVRPLLSEGWVYLNPLLEALKEFETNRNRYPTLRSFMPQIISAFRRIQPQDIERWQQQAKQMSNSEVTLPQLGDIYGKENVLFILSTGETDREGHARLKVFVEAHQASAFPLAEVVDDTVALTMDLSKYHLFVVGTPSGNRYLQTVLPQLPVRITAKGVVAGRKYEGSGYAFMSGWINPVNSLNVMAIYTAQDPDDLVNFTAIPRGGTHYHLAKNLITIKAENYQRRNTLWICK